MVASKCAQNHIFLHALTRERVKRGLSPTSGQSGTPGSLDRFIPDLEWHVAYTARCIIAEVVLFSALPRVFSVLPRLSHVFHRSPAYVSHFPLVLQRFSLVFVDRRALLFFLADVGVGVSLLQKDADDRDADESLRTSDADDAGR